MRRFLTLLFVLILSGGLYGVSLGPLIFSDDFETVGLFAENWEAGSGIVPEAGAVRIPWNGYIQLRSKMTGKDFAVSADLTPSLSNGEYGHTGFIIDGINFMLYSNGKAGTAYRPPSYEQSLGQAALIPNYHFGDTCKVTVVRQQTGESRKYIFQVNDKPLITFQDSSMIPTDTIRIYAYRAGLVIDNVTVHSVSEGSDSPNLVINSSFEHLQDGMPPYVNLATKRTLTWKTPYSEYLKTAVIDTAEKHSGDHSLRLTFNDSVTEAGFLMYHAGCTIGKPVTGSVWLKADRPQLNATLNFWELHHKFHSRTIKVTDQWQRYELTLPNPERNQVQFGVSLSEPGVIWADDVQVELGETVTPYRPSALDEDKFNTGPQKPAQFMPDAKIAAVEKAPMIDGDLSDFPQACRVDAFLYKGNEISEDRTVAWLACDKQNLYVAFRCFVPDASKVEIEQLPRDLGTVYNPESIEMFFDPTSSRKDYYQLAVNAGNSQADCGPGRNPGWNGEWRSAVKINRQENCIDYEIAIPLSNFADADMTDSWNFNLGRNCKESGRLLSLLYTPQLNYHLISIYPKLVFPTGTLDSARIGLADCALYEGADGKATFETTVRNVTGKEIGNATLQLLDSKTDEILGSTAVDLPAGDFAVKLASQLANTTKDRDVAVRILGTDNTVLTRKNVLLSVAGALNVYNRYSFYLKDANAEFLGNCALPPGEYQGIASVAGKTFGFEVTPELKIQIPLAGFEPGNYTVQFDINAGGNKVASGSAAMMILPERQAPYCRIDRKHRALEVGGKPALMVAPFLGVERHFTPEMSRMFVKTFADAGFKYVTCGSHEPDSAATRAFMEEAEKQGIKVVYWNFYAWRMREQWTPADFAAKVQYPNLLAVLIVDEPELYAQSDEVKAFMQNYQNALPEVPVFMNNTVIGIPARFADLTTDIVMIDDYLTNSETRTVTEMVNNAEMVESAGRSERKPAWFFPSGDNLHNHYRECSYDEQLAQCYGMLIKGCTGLVHFSGLPKYPRNWEALQQVNREFLNLQEAVFSEEACSKAIPADKSLVVLTRKAGNKVYVIVLNPGKNPVTSAIRLPAEYRYANDTEVRFENRSLPVTDGVIQDEFKALERHVYVTGIRE